MKLADTERIRYQALTLLLAAYDEVRRALTYMRWRAGDLETIAPSVFFKNGHREVKNDKPQDAPAAPTPAAPTPAATPSAAPAAAGAATAEPAPRPGMPGAKLFADA